jgi:predicted aspartyl protease
MIGLSIVAANRATLGRQVLGTVFGAVVAGGLLFAQPGRVSQAPPPEISGSGNALILPASSNGRCSTSLSIGKTRLPDAIADSGAGEYLTIGPTQAKQAGLDVDRLQFRGTYQSAHGRGRIAEIRVPSVRIGNVFQVIGVTVDVTDVDQPEPLIGIQLLRDFNFRVRADHCELSLEEEPA